MAQGNEVIEPSEILVDLPEEKADYSHVSPWTRFLARFLDYSIFQFFLRLAFILSRGEKSLPLLEWFIPLSLFAWIPLEALLLSLWGYTPGKFFLKTTVRKGMEKKLTFKEALHRALSLWMRGLGLGIPFLNIVAMLIAFSHLKTQGMCSWDRKKGFIVTHHPVKRYRLMLALAFIILNGVLFEIV